METSSSPSLSSPLLPSPLSSHPSSYPFSSPLSPHPSPQPSSHPSLLNPCPHPSSHPSSSPPLSLTPLLTPLFTNPPHFLSSRPYSSPPLSPIPVGVLFLIWCSQCTRDVYSYIVKSKQRAQEDKTAVDKLHCTEKFCSTCVRLPIHAGSAASFTVFNCVGEPNSIFLTIACFFNFGF